MLELNLKLYWQSLATIMNAPRTNSWALFCQLHWLPAEFRLRRKLARLSYNILNTSTPTYLQAIVSSVLPHSLHVQVFCWATMLSWAFVQYMLLPWETEPIARISEAQSPCSRKHLEAHSDLSNIRISKCINTWWLTNHASDSQFCVTAHIASFRDADSQRLLIIIIY